MVGLGRAAISKYQERTFLSLNVRFESQQKVRVNNGSLVGGPSFLSLMPRLMHAYLARDSCKGVPLTCPFVIAQAPSAHRYRDDQRLLCRKAPICQCFEHCHINDLGILDPDGEATVAPSASRKRHWVYT